MDDTGLQSALNQLPQNLEQPVNPAPPIPPPIPPSPPPVPDPEQPVPEQPATAKPAGRFKKNAKKIVVGTLMFMLLAGGAYFGVNEVQKRQTVEQQAARVVEEGKYVPQLTETEYQDKLKNYNTVVEGCILEDKGNNYAILGRIPGCGGAGDDSNACPAGTTLVCDPNSPKYCRGKYAGKWYQRDVGCCSEPVEECERNSWGKKTCSTTCFDPLTYDCVCLPPAKSFSSPSPSPSPSVTPSPSPSPSPSASCVDLTSNKTAPTMGDTASFTCEANFTPSPAISPVAYFRYSTDNGVTFTDVNPAGTAVNTTTLKASQDISINKQGDWEVQCRICATPALATCTDWGKAN